MKILSLDPGLNHLGFALIITTEGQSELTHFGYIHIPREDMSYNDYLNGAIAGLSDTFPRLIENFNPDLVVAEMVPPGKLGSNSELVTAGLAAIKVVCWQFGVEWHDIAANTVKLKIVGNGRAKKTEVRAKLFENFPILIEKQKEEKANQRTKKVPVKGIPIDVFDAIAIGFAKAQLLAEQGEL